MRDVKRHQVAMHSRLPYFLVFSSYSVRAQSILKNRPSELVQLKKEVCIKFNNMYLHCAAKKLHHFIFAITLSKLTIFIYTPVNLEQNGIKIINLLMSLY